VPHIK